MSLMEKAAAEMHAAGERMVKVAEQLGNATVPKPPAVIRVQFKHGGGFVSVSAQRYLVSKILYRDGSSEVGLSVPHDALKENVLAEMTCAADEEVIVTEEGAIRFRKRSAG